MINGQIGGKRVGQRGGTALRALAIVPAIFALGVVVHSAQQPQAFDRYHIDPIANNAIGRYVPVVKNSEIAVSDGDPESLRTVAKQWVSGTADGTLKPLPMQRVTDTMQYGVKQQILSSAFTVGGHMEMIAGSEGSTDAALADYLLAVKVINGLRYSDLTTVATVGGFQRRILQKISLLIPSMNPQSIPGLLNDLKSIKANPEMIEKLDENLKHYQKIEFERLLDVARASNAPMGEVPGDRDMNMRLATHNEEESTKALDHLQKVAHARLKNHE